MTQHEPANVDYSVAHYEATLGADHVAGSIVLRQMRVWVVDTSYHVTSARCCVCHFNEEVKSKQINGYDSSLVS